MLDAAPLGDVCVELAKSQVHMPFVFLSYIFIIYMRSVDYQEYACFFVNFL